MTNEKISSEHKLNVLNKSAQFTDHRDSTEHFDMINEYVQSSLQPRLRMLTCIGPTNVGKSLLQRALSGTSINAIGDRELSYGVLQLRKGDSLRVEINGVSHFPKSSKEAHDLVKSKMLEAKENKIPFNAIVYTCEMEDDCIDVLIDIPGLLYVDQTESKQLIEHFIVGNIAVVVINRQSLYNYRDATLPCILELCKQIQKIDKGRSFIFALNKCDGINPTEDISLEQIMEAFRENIGRELFNFQALPISSKLMNELKTFADDESPFDANLSKADVISLDNYHNNNSYTKNSEVQIPVPLEAQKAYLSKVSGKDALIEAIGEQFKSNQQDIASFLELVQNFTDRFKRDWDIHFANNGEMLPPMYQNLYATLTNRGLDLMGSDFEGLDMFQVQTDIRKLKVGDIFSLPTGKVLVLKRIETQNPTISANYQFPAFVVAREHDNLVEQYTLYTVNGESVEQPLQHMLLNDSNDLFFNRFKKLQNSHSIDITNEQWTEYIEKVVSLLKDLAQFIDSLTEPHGNIHPKNIFTTDAGLYIQGSNDPMQKNNGLYQHPLVEDHRAFKLMLAELLMATRVQCTLNNYFKFPQAPEQTLSKKFMGFINNLHHSTKSCVETLGELKNISHYQYHSCNCGAEVDSPNKQCGQCITHQQFLDDLWRMMAELKRRERKIELDAKDADFGIERLPDGKIDPNCEAVTTGKIRLTKPGDLDKRTKVAQDGSIKNQRFD